MKKIPVYVAITKFTKGQTGMALSVLPTGTHSAFPTPHANILDAG